MTTSLRTGAAAVVAALTLSGAVVSAPQAQAAGRDYTTVMAFSSAQLKACKVSVQRGTMFRVYAFLDNTAAQRKDDAFGAINVLMNGTATRRTYESGYIQGGKKSTVGSVLVPRKPGITVQLGVGGRVAGDGRTTRAGEIGTC